MRMLREVGRGFLCAMNEDLRGPSAQTVRHLSLTHAVLFAESAQTRCASDPETTTWKKESLFFFPSSTAIYLSRGGAILLSGKDHRLHLFRRDGFLPRAFHQANLFSGRESPNRVEVPAREATAGVLPCHLLYGGVEVEEGKQFGDFPFALAGLSREVALREPIGIAESRQGIGQVIRVHVEALPILDDLVEEHILFFRGLETGTQLVLAGCRKWAGGADDTTSCAPVSAPAVQSLDFFIVH